MKQFFKRLFNRGQKPWKYAIVKDREGMYRVRRSRFGYTDYMDLRANGRYWWSKTQQYYSYDCCTDDFDRAFSYLRREITANDGQIYEKVEVEVDEREII